MPKQIVDVKNKLFHTTKHILKTEGYMSLSMRKVAMECGIAVGTVYNYVKNKDELVALVIMEDWTRALDGMGKAAVESLDVADGMCGIYRALMAFIGEYQDIWTQYSQTGGSSNVIAAHHLMLRGQISAQIQRLLEQCGQTSLSALVPLLAETVLAAAMQPDIEENLVRMLTERLL